MAICSTNFEKFPKHGHYFAGIASPDGCSCYGGRQWYAQLPAWALLLLFFRYWVDQLRSQRDFSCRICISRTSNLKNLRVWTGKEIFSSSVTFSFLWMMNEKDPESSHPRVTEEWLLHLGRHDPNFGHKTWRHQRRKLAHAYLPMVMGTTNDGFLIRLDMRCWTESSDLVELSTFMWVALLTALRVTTIRTILSTAW